MAFDYRGHVDEKITKRHHYYRKSFLSLLKVFDEESEEVYIKFKFGAAHIVFFIVNKLLVIVSISIIYTHYKLRNHTKLFTDFTSIFFH